jgi:hypothetical protein
MLTANQEVAQAGSPFSLAQCVRGGWKAGRYSTHSAANVDKMANVTSVMSVLNSSAMSLSTNTSRKKSKASSDHPQDNLNIHSKASLYEAFPAAEARRLVERFEWHYTPKHGSWLDLAESELGILSSQCLDRRIPDKQTLIDEIAAWEHDRNANHTKANWHFTTPNARIKLKHLYPSI